MRILVTGAAGYIGSVLCGVLLDDFHEVVAFDDLSCGSASLSAFARRRDFTFILGDVRSERDMAEAIRRVDAIIPLAAVVGMPACDKDPVRAREVNVDAILMLMRLRSKDQRVVFPNTNSGYGCHPITAGVPEVDQAPRRCTEETPLNPISLYGRLKCAAEKIVLDAENTVALRLATVFGMSPRMRRDLLVNFYVWEALKHRRIDVYEGAAMRNYVHVRDVAEAFMEIATGKGWGSPHHADRFVFNFGNDAMNLSKRDLAMSVRNRLDAFGIESVVAPLEGRDPDQRNYIVSSEKLRKAGVVADIMLGEGIDELVRGYQAMPELYSEGKP